jgi:hypothetical protein
MQSELDIAANPPRAELVVRLDAGDLLDIDRGLGFHVTCREGTVWITQANDPRDIALGAGQSFVLDRKGLALVVAPIGPAVVVVTRATAETRSPRFDAPTAGDLRFAV